MKGLLIKDLKLMKSQKNFFFLIIAIAIFMSFTSSDSSFGIAFLGFVGSLFTLSSISYDEFDNGNAFLFSLPISRKSYVLEKYSFGLITGVSLWAFATAMNIIFSIMKNTSPIAEILMIAILILPVIVLMLSLMLPFQIKFGGERGRIAIFATFGVLAVIGVSVVKIAEVLHIDLQSLLNSLPRLSMGMLSFITLLLSFLLMLLSVKISINIMKKKEF